MECREDGGKGSLVKKGKLNGPDGHYHIRTVAGPFGPNCSQMLNNGLRGLCDSFIDINLQKHEQNVYHLAGGTEMPFLIRQSTVESRAQMVSSIGVANFSSFAFLRGPATIA